MRSRPPPDGGREVNGDHTLGFYDREEERATLDGLLGDARKSRSGVLVIRGEAGVGKSALLRYAADRANGFQVANVSGVESEMELPFAGLHQLCAPMLRRIDALPKPQQRALNVALGAASGDAPDRFLVALGALTLLSDAAEQKPFLCFVDDAQWLDGASRQVLGFVARRLLAESVAIVFAIREPSSDADLVGLPELRLKGLADEHAHALLGAAIAGRIDERVRDRIVAETRGNPLALLELPRGLSADQLAGGFGIPDLESLSGPIEQSFLRRLQGLPSDTQLLLLVAAAEPVGDAALMWRAAKVLEIPPAASEPAARIGLVDIGAQVRFRHPLVRSAVYRSASDAQRQEVHEALAVVTDVEVEPDRRAWHRAQAARGPDDDVADELEHSAGRAQARGGLAAAAAFLRRAAELTEEPEHRAGRTLDAAQANLQAGGYDMALALLAAAEAGPLDDLGRARVDLIRAEAAFAENRGRDAPLLLLEAAKTLEELDTRLCRETYLDAWAAALFAGEEATEGGGLADVSRAVANAPRPTNHPRPSDLLLDGLALIFTEGRRAAVPALERAIEAFTGPAVSAQEVLRWGWLATRAANVAWDCESAIEIGMRAVQLARERGALEVLPVAANAYGQAAAFGGDFAHAALLAAEVDAAKEATRTRIAPVAAVALAGIRGHEAEASALIDGMITDARARGQGAGTQYGHWANAVLMNGLGRYGEALIAATEASEDTPELYISAWALSELIEAATRTGDDELARDALSRLSERTEASDADWALGIYVRADALLDTGDSAERSYREAIDRLGRTRLRPELARSRLLYGEWLRRENRRVDAREQLRAAHDAFVSMGVDGFGERARRELVATGEKVRSRGSEARDELTPQEEQIARLAGKGLSNPRDRRTVLPQSAHRRVAPEQGLRQARHYVPHRSPLGAIRDREDARDALGGSQHYVTVTEGHRSGPGGQASGLTGAMGEWGTEALRVITTRPKVSRKEILMSSTSIPQPTPEGPLSVTGAPGLPAGFTDTFTSRYVEAGDVRLHAVTGGEGPPLLLVHGWPEFWYAWRKLMPALAREFEVIAVDQRGIGLSDKPEGGYDTGTLATDLVTLMAALGHEKFAVLGHDTGFAVSYALAADHPDRVERVALAEIPGSPSGSVSTRVGSRARQRQAVASAFQQAREAQRTTR